MLSHIPPLKSMQLPVDTARESVSAGGDAVVFSQLIVCATGSRTYNTGFMVHVPPRSSTLKDITESNNKPVLFSPLTFHVFVCNIVSSTIH